MIVILLLIIGGLVLLTVGAELLVRGSSKLALHLKVPALVVGLTVVAFGTSAPELVVSISSNMRGLGDIAVIFNILAILGITGSVLPVHVHNISAVDLGAMIVVTLFLLPLIHTGYRINRFEGAALLALYGGYLYYLWP